MEWFFLYVSRKIIIPKKVLYNSTICSETIIRIEWANAINLARPTEYGLA